MAGACTGHGSVSQGVTGAYRQWMCTVDDEGLQDIQEMCTGGDRGCTGGDREFKDGIFIRTVVFRAGSVCLVSITVYIKKILLTSLLNNIADEYKNMSLGIKIEL